MCSLKLCLLSIVTPRSFRFSDSFIISPLTVIPFAYYLRVCYVYLSSDTSEGLPEVDSNHTSWFLRLSSTVVGTLQCTFLCLSRKFDSHLQT